MVVQLAGQDGPQFQVGFSVRKEVGGDGGLVIEVMVGSTGRAVGQSCCRMGYTGNSGLQQVLGFSVHRLTG